MTLHEVLDPAGWKSAKGYANGVVASGRMIFLGGTIGWNGQQEFTADDFVGQARQAMHNIVDLLAEAGAGPEHLVRLTWYITDRDAYLANLRELGAAYREVLGRNYPAMAMVQVAGLMESQALVEIEATAVI